jgi:uncharacterized protein (DUF433 family)
MNVSDYIISDPNVMFGKPVIKNTRISVELILEKMADGYSFQDIQDAYPIINKVEIKACLLYASVSVKNEITHQLVH